MDDPPPQQPLEEVESMMAELIRVVAEGTPAHNDPDVAHLIHWLGERTEMDNSDSCLEEARVGEDFWFTTPHPLLTLTIRMGVDERGALERMEGWVKQRSREKDRKKSQRLDCAGEKEGGVPRSVSRKDERNNPEEVHLLQPGEQMEMETPNLMPEEQRVDTTMWFKQPLTMGAITEVRVERRVTSEKVEVTVEQSRGKKRRYRKTKSRGHKRRRRSTSPPPRRPQKEHTREKGEQSSRTPSKEPEERDDLEVFLVQNPTTPELTRRGPVYMVCQYRVTPPSTRPEGVVVICTDPTHKWERLGWPQAAFILTRGEYWLSVEMGTPRERLDEADRIVMGSRIHIRNVRFNRQWKELTSHLDERNLNGAIPWINDVRRPQLQTIANAELAWLRKRPKGVREVGMVVAKRRNGRVCVCALGAVRSTHLHQFESDIPLADLEIGELVKVTIAYTHNADLVGDGYLLPQHAEFQIGTERRQRDDGYILEMNGKMGYPPGLEGRVRQIGDRMAIGTLLTAENYIERAALFSFTGRLERRGCNFVLWQGSRSWKRRQFIEHFEAWKEDALLQVKPHPADKIVAMGRVVGRHPKLDAYGEPTGVFSVHFTLQSVDQQDVKKSLMHESHVHVQVMPSVKALWERVKDLMSETFVEIVLAEDSRGKILRQLLGLEEAPTSKCDQHQHAPTRSTSGLEFTHEQLDTLNAVICKHTSGIIAAGAAAGTGKSETAIEAELAALCADAEVRVVMMAPMNASAVRLARGLPERVNIILRDQDTQPDEEAEQYYSQAGTLLVLGYNAQRRYEDLWRDFSDITVGSKVRDWVPMSNAHDEVLEDQMKVMERQAQRQELEDRAEMEERRRLTQQMQKLQRKEIKKHLDTEQALPALLKTSDFRVIVCTSAMAEREPQVMGTRTHVLYDESTHENVSRAVHLLMFCPNVRKVIITGDVRQKGVFNEDKPALVQDWSAGLGFQPLLWEVLRNGGATKTYLSRNWRSHPAITRLLSYAFYEWGDDAREMIAGIEESKRSLMRRTALQGRLRLAQLDTPVVFLHTTDTHTKERTTNSSRNEGQTRIVSAVAQQLRWALYHESESVDQERPLISVLCLYSGQRRALELELRSMRDHVHVANSDGYQGSDAHVVIGVVTYSRGDNVPDEPAPFILENERALVFTSRAREGMILVGNVWELIQGRTWHRFLTQLTQTVPILDAHRYVELMKEREPRPVSEVYDSHGFLSEGGEIPYAVGLPDFLYGWKDRLTTEERRDLETAETRHILDPEELDRLREQSRREIADGLGDPSSMMLDLQLREELADAMEGECSPYLV